MPRPSSSLARRRPSTSPSPSAGGSCCCCTSAPPVLRRPPSASYATAASTQRPPQAPPVLDFLYPRGGFGFFSRSLPPIVPPASPSPSFAAPPPPPPRPQSEAFDVRSWRPSSLPSSTFESSSTSASLLGWPPSAGRRATLAAQGLQVGGGRCVCGRVRVGLSDLLAIHAPPELPHIRGSSILPSSTSSGAAYRKGHPRTRHLSPAQAHDSLAALWAYATRDRQQVIEVREQLDLVRAFSSVARAVPDLPSEAIDPLSAPSSSSSSFLEQRTSLRRRAAGHMLALLARFALWSAPSPALAPPSSLDPDSSTHASAALLYLDALSLSDDLSALSPSSNPAADAALKRVLLPPPLPLGLSRADRAKQTHTAVENRKTALAVLLDGWERAAFFGSEEAGEAAEQALRVMRDLGGAASVLDAPTSQRAFIDVLRRRYGVILSRLQPSPSRWFTSQEAAASSPSLEPLRLHLVRFLARSGGSAIGALRVWEAVLEREASDASSAATATATIEEDLVRLRAMRDLLDGLTMERLFEDANRLAPEVEKLCLSVQAELSLGSSSDPGTAEDTESAELVVKTFRSLLKLVSDQGRSAAVEQLLARLAAAQLPVSATGPSSSTPALRPTSLEPAVRRLRARSAQDEISAVRALFDSTSATRAFRRASAADRARLWGQLILAYVRVNDVEAGVRALREMVLAGLQAPLSAVNAVLYGYARRGDSRTTFELFSELADGGFRTARPNTSSWGALVLACANARNPSAAVVVVEEMKTVGVVPTRQTWTTLMSAFVENAQWTSAFAVFRFLDTHPDPALRPDTAAVNVMLKACVLTATPAQTVLELFRRLVARGVRPNMPTFTLVLQSLCSAGLMDLAEDFFLLLDKAAAQPSAVPAALFPTAMSRIKPNQFVFANMIGGYLRTGQPAKARVLLNEMRARGMAPTSVTMAIVLGARLQGHAKRGMDYTVHGIHAVLKQTRAFLEDEGLGGRRKSQRVKLDRDLAYGREAVALLAPVVRAFSKASVKAAAFEVFEQALALAGNAEGEEKPLEIGLYTSFMDGVRREDDPDEAAANVKIVFDRLYDLVAERFVRLRPSPTSTSATPLSPAGELTRLVDPAQAGILCLPLTILLETYDAAGWDIPLEQTWRKLANQGFAFDASNWNVLARYFARDMQLERAMWIAENVLAVPVMPPYGSPPPPSPSPDAFIGELADIKRTSAVGRSPVRLRLFRDPERHQQRKQPLDLVQYITHMETRDERGEGEGEGTGESSNEFLTDAFARSYAVRAATLWHPYGATLDAIDAALESLTAGGTTMAYERYLQSRRDQARWRERQRMRKDHSMNAELAGVLEGGADQREEQTVLELPEEAEEARTALMRKYPRTVQAIALWKTRAERRQAERQEHLERLKRGGLAS
ncbi:hypothetical protein JCM10213v2_000863 [Rhodosporidiobolus nylandii]